MRLCLLSIVVAVDVVNEPLLNFSVVSCVEKRAGRDNGRVEDHENNLAKLLRSQHMG